MNKKNHTSRLLFASLVMFGLSGLAQNAFAHQLSCTAQWVTNENTPHCHVVILKKGTKDQVPVCTDKISKEEFKEQEYCESFCNEVGKAGHDEALVSLLFDANTSLTEKTVQLVKAIKTLNAELKLTSQIAGDACVKAKKAKLVLKALVAGIQGKDGEDGDDDDTEELGTKSSKKINPDIQNSMYL